MANKEIVLLNYTDLIRKLGSEKPSYEELLNTHEWKNFRDTIIERDKFTCQTCNKRETYTAYVAVLNN
jgi:hypothetical protein